MESVSALDFLVKTTNLQEVKVQERTYSEDLLPNQVLLEIDQISFSSNNVTYGVVGDKMGYWSFFPTESGYGIIPAWGFANVINSNHSDIKVGQRFYGYYPLSSHLLVSADKVSDKGFVDNAEHRRALSPIYNYYTNTENDPSINKETENFISVFRPLFVTSFLIDDYLAREDFFKASQILLTSASSKTAQALASLLAHRKKESGVEIELIALTSGGNTGFVDDLGWYDKVISYESLNELDADKGTIVVDFAGNHSTQLQLQNLFGDQLVYNCLVGFVDWQNLDGKDPLPKKGELFFAPTHAANRQKEWGIAEFQKKVGMAWQQFIGAISSIITMKEYIGAHQLEALYLDVLNGRIDPKHGNIVRMSGSVKAVS